MNLLQHLRGVQTGHFNLCIGLNCQFSDLFCLGTRHGEEVVIFGATGMIGLIAMEAAVKKGIEVSAFVRTRSKVPAHLKDKVDIFQENVLEPSSVDGGVEGVDALVIALGTNSSLAPTTDSSEGTKNIIQAMKAKGVEIFSAILSYYLFYIPEIIPIMFRNLTVDHRRMYQAVKDSHLNFIAVCPPHITDKPSREIIVTVNPGTKIGTGQRYISKWDLGAFLVDCIS